MDKSQYVITVNRVGAKFHWQMQARNGVIICTSNKGFATAGQARESIQNWLDIIRTKPIYIVEESTPLNNPANSMGTPSSKR